MFTTTRPRLQAQQYGAFMEVNVFPQVDDLTYNMNFARKCGWIFGKGYSILSGGRSRAWFENTRVLPSCTSGRFMMTIFGCDSYWRKRRGKDLVIFQDKVSRLKTYLATVVVATNPASGLYFEIRIARSPFVRDSAVMRLSRSKRDFHRLKVVCNIAACVFSILIRLLFGYIFQRQASTLRPT